MLTHNPMWAAVLMLWCHLTNTTKWSQSNFVFFHPHKKLWRPVCETSTYLTHIHHNIPSRRLGTERLDSHQQNISRLILVTTDEWVTNTAYCWSSRRLYTTVQAGIRGPWLTTVEARSRASENRSPDAECRHWVAAACLRGSSHTANTDSPYRQTHRHPFNGFFF